MEKNNGNYLFSIMTSVFASFQSDSIKTWITFGLGVISFILSILISILKLKKELKDSNGDNEKIESAVHDALVDINDKLDDFIGDDDEK